MDNIQLASGYTPAELQTELTTLAASGYVPYGGLLVTRDGQLAQAMINRAPAGSTVMVTVVSDTQRAGFQAAAATQLGFGCIPTGTALIYQATAICQVFYCITGVAEFTTLTMRVVTSTATQNIAAANTPQPIVWSAITDDSPGLATVNLATGVLTFVNSFAGIITFNARVQRNGALLSGASSWNVQVETSPDGVTWTPFPGSRRNIAFNGGLATTVMNILVDGTFAIRLPAGTRMRITQYSDSTAPTVGIAGTAAASGIASGYAAILSILSTPVSLVI